MYVAARLCWKDAKPADYQNVFRGDRGRTRTGSIDDFGRYTTLFKHNASLVLASPASNELVPQHIANACVITAAEGKVNVSFSARGAILHTILSMEY
jgi:hypothetical protein